jgi:adenosine deaminase
VRARPSLVLPNLAVRELHKFIGRPIVILLVTGLLHSGVEAQSAGRNPSPPNRKKHLTLNESATARYFATIREQPLLLHAFLKQMPKGADLHNHLSGSVYAETYVRLAAESGLCVDTKTLALLPGGCDDAAGRPPASLALKDTTLYGRLVDAWSMRNWEQSGQSAHDHFFDSFGKFGLAFNSHVGEALAEVTSRAAADRLSYLELMYTPDGGRSALLGKQIGWDEEFDAQRRKLISAGIQDAVGAGQRSLDAAEAKRRALLRCGMDAEDGGCKVRVLYLFQVSRGLAREQVFAQLLAGFEMATADPRVAGINLVQPEDWRVSMEDFSLQMRMIDYFHKIYPAVHISLHAGELAPGLVPPEGLGSHIRQSVEQGHAERIGHGVDVMHEDTPIALLREMARRNVMVEVCLSSNDLILGVRGKQHPLWAYLKYGVPVALATDDQGVSRSDMTLEFAKAASEQGLDYIQLKALARTSLEHAFVAGESLWKDPKKFDRVAQCPGQTRLTTACQGFLIHSEKARLQWELEQSFQEFEEHVKGLIH